MSVFEKLDSQILLFLLAACSWSWRAFYYDAFGQRNVYMLRMFYEIVNCVWIDACKMYKT